MNRIIIFRDKEKKRIELEIEIEYKAKSKNSNRLEACFSMSGTSQGSCGQIYDDIKPANKEQAELLGLWKKYHLNDMNAGTLKQSDVVDKAKAKGFKYDYTKACELLDSYNHKGEVLNAIEVKTYQTLRLAEIEARKDIKEKINALNTNIKEEIKEISLNTWNAVSSLFVEMVLFNNEAERNIKDKDYYFPQANYTKYAETKMLEKYSTYLQKQLEARSDKPFFMTLFYDKHPETGKPYQYGTAWLNRELPKGFKKTLNALCDKVEEKTTTDDKMNPIDLWLKQTGTKFFVKYKNHGLYFPGDKDSRDIYTCTLKRGKKSYSFTFGQSIANVGTEPTASEVLSCVETYSTGSFMDFCDCFGYSPDSISAEKTYKAVKKQAEAMHALYTNKELENFEEIKR